MSDKNENAFPEIKIYHQHDGGESKIYKSGMTLRDYFAGQALAGLDQSDSTFSELAHSAYKIADAMMKERENE